MFTAHPLIDAMHAVHGIPPVVRLTRETPHDTSTIPKPGVLARWRAFRIRNAHPRAHRIQINVKP